MNIEKVYQVAVEKYGAEEQERMIVEECAELIQAICKSYRAFGTVASANAQASIDEELADVEIMLEQAKYIYDNAKQVAEVKAHKIQRLKERLEI